MRKIEFSVPVEVMPAFSEAMLTRDLTNTIIGITDEEDVEIIIEVEYDRHENRRIDELEEILENLKDELEEDEEDDDDDNDWDD